MRLYACRCGGLHESGSPCPARARADNARRQRKNQAHGVNRAAWRRRAQRVKQRDGMTCRRCGRHRDELHHNERLSVHLDPALAGNHDAASDHDCITLCSTCHGTIDAPRAHA